MTPILGGPTIGWPQAASRGAPPYWCERYLDLLLRFHG